MLLGLIIHHKAYNDQYVIPSGSIISRHNICGTSHKVFTGMCQNIFWTHLLVLLEKKLLETSNMYFSEIWLIFLIAWIMVFSLTFENLD